MLRRALVIGVCAVVSGVSVIADRTTASAETPTAGTCLVSGTVSFSPGINIVPQSSINGMQISVSGNCTSVPPMPVQVPLPPNFVNLSFQAIPIQSCEAGFATTSSTSVTFTLNPPGGPWSGGGSVLLGPASIVATVTAGIVDGVLTVAWTTPPTPCINPTGVPNPIQVTGLFTYVST